VEETLRALRLQGKPHVTALNKVDLLRGGHEGVARAGETAGLGKLLGEQEKRTVFTSATTGEGLDRLLDIIVTVLHEVRGAGQAVQSAPDSSDD